MPRASTTSDIFNAIAEPKRRAVLGTLVQGEQTVGSIVTTLTRKDGRWSQPQVSKHLSVLRRVGLVNVRRAGRERHYSVNGPAIKPLHDWTAMFEKFWDHQLDRIKRAAEAKAQSLSISTPHQESDPCPPPPPLNH